MISLPRPRGPITEALFAALERPPHPIGAVPGPSGEPPQADEDLQLALYACYELHYRGLPGVDERWEWEPALLAARRELEDRFEAALRDLAGDDADTCAPEEMDV